MSYGVLFHPVPSSKPEKRNYDVLIAIIFRNGVVNGDIVRYEYRTIAEEFDTYYYIQQIAEGHEEESRNEICS